MQKLFRVTVDISKKIPAPAFEVNTNDLKSVKLEITITNGLSLLDLTDVTPRINIRKPDNEVIFQDCEIVDAKAGKVQIVLENQAYLVPGTHTAEIACYKGNEITAITGTFSYKSIKGIMNDEAVESKSEFTAIDRKIEEARKLLEDIGENGVGVGVDEQARQKIEEVTTQLADTSREFTDFKTSGYFIPSEKIQVPTSIGFSVPIEVKKNGVGVFETNIEPENLYPKNPALKTYYVDFTNGSNSNDGLTLATAFKNFTTARDKTDVGTIMMAEGWYDKDQHTFPTDKSIKVKAIEGHNVVFSAHSPVTFSLHSGNTYKATRSATIGVWDAKNTDNYGEYIRMIKATSIAEVENTPNSWYFDSTTNTVYVHCFDNRVPDNDVKVSINAQPANLSGNNLYYVEGITFCFGRGVYCQTLDGNTKPTLLAKNCKFSYSDLENGLNVNGAKLVVLKNCESSNNMKDGFNYHDKQGATGEVIEINCVGRKNGADGAGNNNGSTAHENYKIARISGWYTENEGPNVADVGSTLSLNIGCTASNSITKTGNKANFISENKIWLDNCVARDSLHAVQSGSDSTVIKIRNSLLIGQLPSNAESY